MKRAQSISPKPGMRGLHDPFGDTPQANLFGHDMEVSWDGSFEVYIGGERPDPKECPNWLPTTPDPEPRHRHSLRLYGFSEVLDPQIVAVALKP